VYLYAAIEPATGDRCRSWPECKHRHFNVFLRMLSKELGPLDHAVQIMDQAGWHRSKQLKMTDTSPRCCCRRTRRSGTGGKLIGITCAEPLPGNRAYRDYDHLLDAGTQAYRSLTNEW